MQKLILKIVTAIVFLSGPQCFASEKIEAGYFYTKLGDQWLVCPGIGFGYRHHRYDLDLTVYSYLDSGFALYGKGHYLYFPQKEHFYMGIGSGIIGGKFSFLTDKGNFIKPTVEGVLGYEWNKKIFLQLEIGGSYGAMPLYPILSIGFGF